jgi:hypothetical protein
MSNSNPPVQGSQSTRVNDAAALSIDQAALNFTQSQAGTSYASSLFRTTRGSTIWDDDRSTSVYSYNTARDANKFLKEVEGRVSTFQYTPMIPVLIFSLFKTFNVLNETYFLPTGTRRV